MKKTLLSIVAIITVCYLAPAVEAGPIEFGQWYEFSFVTVGVTARGCLPADPLGEDCVPSSAGNTVFGDAPPWTFTAPPFPTTLTITDAFLRGDAFQVFDFGSLILTTPSVAPIGTCVSNPDVCVVDPRVSHGQVSLAPGPHSITIAPTAIRVSPGAAYFRVDTVPEPSTYLLFGTGFLGLLGYGWWKRQRAA